MDYRIIEDQKYISLKEVSIFLEYKRPNVFIKNVISKSKNIIDDDYIRVEELILILRKNTRNKVDELFRILLNEEHNREIIELREIVVAKCEARVVNIYNTNINTFFKNIHTILSSYKIELIDNKKCLEMLKLYNLKSMLEASNVLWEIYEDGLPLSKEEIYRNETENKSIDYIFTKK